MTKEVGEKYSWSGQARNTATEKNRAKRRFKDTTISNIIIGMYELSIRGVLSARRESSACFGRFGLPNLFAMLPNRV